MNYRIFIYHLQRDLLAILLAVLVNIHCFGNDQKSFVNRTIDIEHFEIFFEDHIGRVWGGSYANGPMLFNGDTFVRKTQWRQGIHCYAYLGGDDYLIGCNNGLFRLNMRTLDYQKVKGFEYDDIRTIERQSADLYLCFCDKRIASLNISSGECHTLREWKDIRLVKAVRSEKNRFFITTDRYGIYTFDAESQVMQFYDITGLPFQNEMLLELLLDGQTLWIGTDRQLYRYDLPSKHLSSIPYLQGKTIKTLCKDTDGGLWIGTNNGLFYWRGDTDKWQHFHHSTKQPESILNDCVWALYQDQRGNIWAGVEGGVSFISKEQRPVQINWNWDNPSELGNRINRVFHDSRGGIWMGGVNGLSYHRNDSGETLLFNAFSENRLPDNTIRCIYEDREGLIWIGTDGGLSYFDADRERFITCMVADKTTGLNSIWTYGIREDDKGRLWLATCSGGIFCVDRAELLRHGDKTTTWALGNYSKKELPNIGCMGLVKTSDGALYSYAAGDLYKIDVKQKLEGKIPPVTIEKVNSVVPIIEDGNTVWGYGSNHLIKATPTGVELIDVRSLTDESGEIMSLTCDEKCLWLLTSRRVIALDKHNLEPNHILDLPLSQYKSICFDRERQSLWLGGTDHCLIFNPKSTTGHRNVVNTQSVLSEIYVNNTLLSPSKEVNSRQVIGKDIAFCDAIVLNNDENSLAFRFSMGIVSEGIEFQTGYFYRMRGLNNEWVPIRPDNPLVEFPYLHFGKYYLEIGAKDENGSIKVIRSVIIQIKAPWYRSWWFLCLLLGIALWLLIATINHYRLRAKYHVAEIDRKRTTELSQMKMNFITEMSHEMKTPLTLIMGAVNKLLASSKSPNTRETMRIVQHNISKINTVISQLMNIKEYSTIEDAGHNTCIEAVEFVGSIVGLFEDVCCEKDITLTFQSDEHKYYVEIDPMKMESAINNLLSNALKFTPKGGCITVSVESGVKISVADTGMGIPEADLPKVFTRFFQSDYHQAVNPNGSGIGLYMVKNYVEEQGGKISIASEVGKGTVFTIILPECKHLSSPGNQRGDLSRGADVDAIKVLVVEDNIEIANFITDGLKGMCCTLAHNGKSGYELAQQQQPDIIISDIMMPVISGEELAHLLRHNVKTQHIPIILLTAKDDKQTELNAYKKGVDAFISKPFDIDQLVARIHQMVASRKKLLKAAIRQASVVTTDEQAQFEQSDDDKFLESLTSIIEQHLDNSDFNMAELSRLMSIGEKQIYRKVKLLTGTTVVDYIKSIRLKKAALLLSQKKFSIKEVAYMTGFTSQSYFAKCFVEKYGRSPKEYIENGY